MIKNRELDIALVKKGAKERVKIDIAVPGGVKLVRMEDEKIKKHGIWVESWEVCGRFNALWCMKWLGAVGINTKLFAFNISLSVIVGLAFGDRERVWLYDATYP